MQNTNNLRVAHAARTVALEVYRTTARFPKSELYGLTSQMRRAAVSIGSNIAEGCGRGGNRELLQFLFIAMGSASELQFQCEIATGLEFGDPDAVARMTDEVGRLKGMLAKLITALRRQPPWRRPERSE